MSDGYTLGNAVGSTDGVADGVKDGVGVGAPQIRSQVNLQHVRINLPS